MIQIQPSVPYHGPNLSVLSKHYTCQLARREALYYLLFAGHLNHSAACRNSSQDSAISMFSGSVSTSLKHLQLREVSLLSRKVI